MSLDPNSARSRSSSPAPNSYSERRCSTPGLRPSAVPSRTPSPSLSPAMLPQGLGIHDADVDWSPIGTSGSDAGSHGHHHHSHNGNGGQDRWRLTGRKGYNALPNTPPRDLSPGGPGQGRSRSVDVSSFNHHHHHSRHGSHGSSGLTPPSPTGHLAPPMPTTPPMSGALHGRKGYNAYNHHHHHREADMFSPTEVSGDSSVFRTREHGLSAMGRKGYNSTPRSLSPRSAA